MSNPNQAAPYEAVDAAPRRLRALELRRDGWTYREIAEELKVSISTAHGYIVEGLSEIREQIRQKAEELQSLELLRLDALIRKLWDKVDDDPSVAMIIIKIGERRSKLLGLDAPTDLRLGGIPGGAPIQTKDSLDLSKLTLDDLEHLQAIYQKAGPGAAPLALPVATGNEP